MTTDTLTLTDFLLARIAEDEAAAAICAEAFPPRWEVSDRGHSATVRADKPTFAVVSEIDQVQETPGRWPGEHLDHIARFDPARVLAECEAKRRIVEATRFDDDPRSAVDEWLGHPDMTPPREVAVMIDTLLALAAVYAGHPDYRDEWRP